MPARRMQRFACRTIVCREPGLVLFPLLWRRLSASTLYIRTLNSIARVCGATRQLRGHLTRSKSTFTHSISHVQAVTYYNTDFQLNLIQWGFDFWNHILNNIWVVIFIYESIILILFVKCSNDEQILCVLLISRIRKHNFAIKLIDINLGNTVTGSISKQK